jgi:hypothetical protein
MYVGYTESFFVRFFVLLNSYVCRWNKIFRMWIFYILLTCVILNPHRWGRCLTRTGPKYVGSSFWTESLRMNVGYTNSFSVCFFVNTYDTVHNVLIKIHIVFTIAYNTRMELAEIFFSQKSVIARKRSVTPFFGAKLPLSPPPKKTASAAKPILACLYKTLTMGARCSCGQFVLVQLELELIQIR